MDAATASSIVSFLQTTQVPFGHIGSAVSTRLAQLLDDDVDVYLSCGPRVEGDAAPALMGFSSGGGPTLPVRDGLLIKDNVIEVPTPGLDKRGFITPGTYLRIPPRINPALYPSLATLSAELITRLLFRQQSIVRREIISAKFDSSDLGSFLYRVLTGTLLEPLSVEAGSVFVVDRTSQLLRLRGTTGLQTPSILSNIFIRQGTGAVEWNTFETRRPTIEYSSDGTLSTGKSGERISGKYWARVNWPIQLKYPGRGEERMAYPCLGVLRLVNRRPLQDGSSQNLPFLWTDLALFQFAAESIFNIVDAYHDAEIAGFRKERAFHGAAGVAEGLAKNVDQVRRLIFPRPGKADPIIKEPLYQLVPRGNGPQLPTMHVQSMLDTAYACALDIGFQIERANYEFRGDKDAITDRLITKVLQRAKEMVPDICRAHSVLNRFQVTDVLSLVNRPDVPPPPPVRGSEDALVSVFLNIFENAVKYHRPGKNIFIGIDVHTRDRFVDISVRDYGIGISDGEEGRIFLQGYRSDEAIDQSVRGTGLGLWWCKSVLEFFGGDIVAIRKEPGLEIRVSLDRADTGRDNVQIRHMGRR